MGYAKLMKHELLSPSEELNLIQQAQNGCIPSRDKLILSNMRYIHKVCSKYTTTTVSADDLIGDGVQGMICAIERFDVSRNNRLSTLADFMVSQHVWNSPLRKKHIRIPQNTTQSVRKVERAIAELALQGNLAPINTEIAAQVQNALTPERIEVLRRAIDTQQEPLSLDTLIQNEAGDTESTLADVADVIAYEDPAFDRIHAEMDLDFFFSYLSPEEIFVLCRTYGIPWKMSYREIAATIGCHHNDVVFMRRRAFEKCQRIASADDDTLVTITKTQKSKTQLKLYTVFLVTCKRNMRHYVGTTCLTLQKKLKTLLCDDENSPLRHDAVKYGKNAFAIKALHKWLTKQEADKFRDVEIRERDTYS